MTAKITTDPKASAAAAPTAKHGCCGGEAAVESLTDTARLADHEHREHAGPSKAAESSCCCGTTKPPARPE